MINTFRLKKTPTIEACQWNGENVREIEEFLNDFGGVRGIYVEYGCVRNGVPQMGTVRIGQYLVKTDLGCYRTMNAEDLFELYTLED